jgi:putative ABC transport system permease protein
MTTIDSFLKTFSLISSITFFFGTLIAVVIIYSLISINVRNKRVEIGILRALGVRERFIIYTYLFLTIFYLISSLALSVIILKLFEIFFYYNPIHSPFGLIRPAIDYKFFIVNFIKLSIFLIFIAYLPIKEVVKENLLSQIRS